jgi:hypothetical protein
VPLVDADAKSPFRLRELAAIVDAIERAVVVEPDRAHDPAVLAGQLDELGEVQLAVRRGRREGVDAAPEPGRVEGIHARVDLVCLQLLLGRVARLDDALDRAELAPHDAPQLGRVRGINRREGDGGVVEPALLDHGDELLARDERDIAGQDEHLLDRPGQLL